jgi:hypothetical protein
MERNYTENRMLGSTVGASIAKNASFVAAAAVQNCVTILRVCTLEASGQRLMKLLWPITLFGKIWVSVKESAECVSESLISLVSLHYSSHLSCLLFSTLVVSSWKLRLKFQVFALLIFHKNRLWMITRTKIRRLDSCIASARTNWWARASVWTLWISSLPRRTVVSKSIAMTGQWILQVKKLFTRVRHGSWIL